jgi:hypothetical protein
LRYFAGVRLVFQTHFIAHRLFPHVRTGLSTQFQVLGTVPKLIVWKTSVDYPMIGLRLSDLEALTVISQAISFVQMRLGLNRRFLTDCAGGIKEYIVRCSSLCQSKLYNSHTSIHPVRITSWRSFSGKIFLTLLSTIDQRKMDSFACTTKLIR